MKSLLSALLFFALCTLVSPAAKAQAPGTHWPPEVGESSTDCGSNSSMQQPGGETHPGGGSPLGWPMRFVVEILRLADPQFPTLNLGEMVVAYRACGCVITYLGENTFLIQIGGNIGIVVAEDLD